ncbi:hypothetical protein ACQJBY_022620 [Aegilops geniculata]
MVKCRICRHYWRHLVKHHGYADRSHRHAPESHRRQPSFSSAAMANPAQLQARAGLHRQAPSSATRTATHSESQQDEEYEQPEYIIRGPPPAIQYCGELEKYCQWGNEEKLYQHHVNKLYAMSRRRKPDIKYYVCTINKTFAKPGQRMYFQVHYTKEKMEEYIKPDGNTLKVRLANINLRTNCRIMLGTDKRATITTNWSEFRRRANIHEGRICAFPFKVTAEHRSALIVHVL